MRHRMASMWIPMVVSLKNSSLSQTHTHYLTVTSHNIFTRCARNSSATFSHEPSPDVSKNISFEKILTTGRVGQREFEVVDELFLTQSLYEEVAHIAHDGQGVRVLP